MERSFRRGDPQRQSYWEDVLRRWREGGQSGRDFCRAEGLRESAFYFWRRKLARGDERIETVERSRRQTRPRTRASQQTKRSRRRGPQPSFLPVRLVKPGLAEAARGVEIVLAEGRTVRVPAGFDRQTLADVLAVLEARPC